jgi:hypothetical protein
MSERQLLSKVVNRALGSVRVDEPHEWLGLCPPPCSTTLHTLTDVALNHEEDAPIFVLQPRREPIPGSSIGIIVCGNSRLAVGTERLPIIERLTPRLAVMSLRAVLTADLPATLREMSTNVEHEAMSVRFPVAVDNGALRFDASQASPDDVDLGLLILA